MKLVLIGNLEPDHSTENDWRRAFQHFGWDVATIQENQVESIPWLEQRVLDEQPDLVLYVRTWGLPPELTDLWRRLETAGIPSASAHLDRYYDLGSPKGASVERYNMPAVDPQFKTTFVFTADGDNEERFKRDGVNHFWLPPGVRHDEARDIEPTEEDRERFGRFAVGFCGARGYHKEHDRAGLVDALADRYGDRFVRVAGDTPWGTVRGEALNRMYATVPVWVGDSCFAGTSEKYVSDRFFETWGRGGFLVFPRLAGIEALVNAYPYPSWEPYEDREAMFGAIDFWLDRPEARDEVRSVMARMVRLGHTYVDRVRQMLDTIGLPVNAVASRPSIVLPPQPEYRDDDWDDDWDDRWPDVAVEVLGLRTYVETRQVRARDLRVGDVAGYPDERWNGSDRKLRWLPVEKIEPSTGDGRVVWFAGGPPMGSHYEPFDLVEIQVEV